MGLHFTQLQTPLFTILTVMTLRKRLQSEDRAHRIGQTKSVTYVDIICEDTVDEKITKALRRKINIASEVLGEELKAWI
jgi:SNF2 family DNA or RNA helicase